jgi:hypothetical protein
MEMTQKQVILEVNILFVTSEGKKETGLESLSPSSNLRDRAL